MQLTYGYDLKENDGILMPARRTGEIMKLLILPGAAVINHLPFREVPPLSPTFFLTAIHIQSNASLRGFLGSSMNQWQANVRN